MKKVIFISLIAFIVFLKVPAFSQDIETNHEQDSQTRSETERSFRFSVEAGLEANYGYTLYQIGGLIKEPDGSEYRVWFPLSELKFPLDVFMLSLDLNGEFFTKYFLHANVKTNITNHAGKMEDSDWGVLSGDPDSLEIYSESDARLEALILDTDFQVKVFSRSIITLLAGAGFLFENFQFDVSNVNQTSVNPSYTGYAAGKVLTYEIDYYIPYLKITPCFEITEKIKIMHSFAISPYVIAKDVDDHLLRYKESKGDARGMAFITSLKSEFKLSSSVNLNITLNYKYITAEGTQSQYQYREYYNGEETVPVGPIGEIENKIKSSRYSAEVKAGVVF
ncbi:MAG: omptin family outer membrane protease [Spirochaetes bacterium]|nr:omptin family outer membrane protease [Spirochaetota bacterium]